MTFTLLQSIAVVLIGCAIGIIIARLYYNKKFLGILEDIQEKEEEAIDSMFDLMTELSAKHYNDLQKISIELTQLREENRKLREKE